MDFALRPTPAYGTAALGVEAAGFDLLVDGSPIGRVVPPLETSTGETLPWAVCLGCGSGYPCDAPPTPLTSFFTEFQDLDGMRSFLGVVGEARWCPPTSAVTSRTSSTALATCAMPSTLAIPRS